MEHSESFDEHLEPAPSEPVFQFGADATTKRYMSDMARWGKVLAMISLIWLGLLLAFSIVNVYEVAKAYESYNGGRTNFFLAGSIVGVCLMIGLFVYPLIALYKGFANLQPAIETEDQARFTAAFRQLRSAIKYAAILNGVIMFLYAAGFIIKITKSGL